MKTKLFTRNIDIAAVAAFGGLIAISYFALFMEQYGIHISVVALAISIWGFLSLKQLDTPKPKKQRWRKIGFTMALIVFMGGGLLFGTIKMIDATQTEVPACIERTRPDCIPKTERPPCPKPKRLCTLKAAEQSEQLYHKE